MRVSIDTVSLRKYLDFFQKNKDSGFRFYEAVRFNFDGIDSSKVQAQTGRWVAEASLTIIKMDKGLTLEPFYVKVDDLARLASYYSVLDIDENKVFYGGEDSFSLPTFDPQGTEVEPFLPITSEVPLDFGADGLSKSISRAIPYYESDPLSPFNGVFIRKGRLIATDKRRMYEEILVKEGESGYELELNLPQLLISYLVSQAPNNATIGSDDDNLHYLLQTRDKDGNVDFTLQVAVNQALTIVDTTDPNFVAAYDHPDFFTVDRDELSDVLKFLLPFVQTLANERIYLDFKNGLSAKVTEQYKIDKRVTSFKTKSPDFFKALAPACVSTKHLLRVLDTFDPGEVQFHYSPGSMVINITQEGKSYHAIYSRLSEEV